jgi:hypothetical protein
MFSDQSSCTYCTVCQLDVINKNSNIEPLAKGCWPSSCKTLRKGAHRTAVLPEGWQKQCAIGRRIGYRPRHLWKGYVRRVSPNDILLMKQMIIFIQNIHIYIYMSIYICSGISSFSHFKQPDLVYLTLVRESPLYETSVQSSHMRKLMDKLNMCTSQ